MSYFPSCNSQDIGRRQILQITIWVICGRAVKEVNRRNLEICVKDRVWMSVIHKQTSDTPKPKPPTRNSTQTKLSKLLLFISGAYITNLSSLSTWEIMGKHFRVWKVVQVAVHIWEHVSHVWKEKKTETARPALKFHMWTDQGWVFGPLLRNFYKLLFQKKYLCVHVCTVELCFSFIFFLLNLGKL